MTYPKHVFLTVSVWGQSYIEDYLNLSLPCQLAQDNLPSIANNSNYVVNYIIVTDESGKEKISRHVCFNVLNKLVTVSFVSLSKLEENIQNKRNSWRKFPDNVWKKYALKMEAMKHGIALANASAGLFIPLMSDLVISNGSFSYLLSQNEQGKKCVLVGSLKVIKDKFLQDTRTYYSEKTFCFSMTGKQLVQKSIINLHPWTYDNSVSSTCYDNSWPDYVYWILPDLAVIQAGNFCYPFLIDCSDKISVLPDYTIDTMALPFTEEEYHVVTNPNDCMVMVLEEPTAVETLMSDIFDPVSVATFRVKETQKHHQLFSSHVVVFGDENNPKVKEFTLLARQQADEISNLEKQIGSSDYLQQQLQVRALIQNLGRCWLSKIPKFVDSVVKQSSGVLAFGAGNELKALLSLTAFGNKLKYIVDNSKNLQGTFIEGVEVISVEQAKSRLKDGDKIIICSQRHHEKMYLQLVEMNIDKTRIITLLSNEKECSGELN